MERTSTVRRVSALALIYVAGPFRGPTPLDVRRNVEAARDVGLKIAQLGAYPVIPHTMTSEFDKQLEDQFWLEGTLALLDRCDAIFLMSKWIESTGARNEHQYALQEGIPVFDENQSGYDLLTARLESMYPFGPWRRIA